VYTTDNEASARSVKGPVFVSMEDSAEYVRSVVGRASASMAGYAQGARSVGRQG